MHQFFAVTKANKNRLCSKTCGKEMNTEREKIRKNLKNRTERCQKREKTFDLYLNPILRHTVWPDNFFCKIEKIGHPQIKLGGSGEI